MGWLIVALIVLALIFVPYLLGNPGFWHRAAEHPDRAYDWFQEEDCWVIEDPSGPPPDFSRPEEDYAGPFQLQVPKLGNGWVNIYGEADRIEESQERFLRHLDSK